MNIKALLAGVALLAVAAPAAHADVIIYDTYSSPKGTSGTDAQGNPWTFSTGNGGESAWGVPGLGYGEVTYNTTTGYAATDFTISFSYFVNSAIDQTPATLAAYEETTRFVSDVGGTLTLWTPVFDGTKSVTFNAPTGVSLVNGDQYFVNVVFYNGKVNGSDAGFSAGFSTVVPETSTWAMMLAGFGALAFAGYRRRAVAA